ncbi:ABC transporter permease subunit [Methyloligella sp. 2.7D]|uniref:ABC transporter permease n=1 Tax=unclassified Methyloligella TaxID=2625955 RepID=UPI00157DF126|nr:ABC transporter permease subunit [Methyloligella sp. GL2]QKP76659.1 ABC transporter permease subunit [Methyloligella sp. GL2]
MMRTRPGPIATILAALACLFMLLPLIAVFPVSFTPKRYISLPEDEWSFRHYQSLLAPEWWHSILLSAQVGAAAAALATLLALLFTLGLWMMQPRRGGLMTGFVLLPMVAPPVVSALTFYFFLNEMSQVNDVVGYDTWAGVAVAHAVMVVPFAVVILMVALAQLDRKLDLAARSMGASVTTRIFRIILPNIRFGVISAFFLCFVLSWDEINVTLFVTSIDAITLPRRMWTGLRDNVDPAVAAISVVMIVVVTLVVTARAIWLRRKAG